VLCISFCFACGSSDAESGSVARRSATLSEHNKLGCSFSHDACEAMVLDALRIDAKSDSLHARCLERAHT
jgi:hypothetical protein